MIWSSREEIWAQIMQSQHQTQFHGRLGRGHQVARLLPKILRKPIQLALGGRHYATM